MARSPDIRIGVIGCGHWGPNHIRTFSSTPGATVIAGADPDRNRVQEMSKLHGSIRFTQNYRDILKDNSIEAVIIATPTSTHGKITYEALEARKHVLVEKPLCTSVKEGETLLKVAKRKKRILMVGQVFLFNNGILKLKELMDFGDLGTIYYIGSTRTNLGPIRQDVNTVYDLASHDISIFNFLTGSRPAEVSAVGEAFLQEGLEDLAFISMRYPEKVLSRIHVSWLDPRKVREITIVGSKKMVTWDDLAAQGPVQVYDKGIIREPYYEDYGQFHLLAREGDIVIPRVKLEEPLKNQARYFLNAIDRGVAEVSNGEAGLDVVRVLEAVQKSLRGRGAPIPVG